MPSSIAAILYLGIVAFLWRREFKARPNVTAALWIPFLWFFLICTRTFSQWLMTFGVSIGGNSYEEGNPLDAAIFFAIILSGALVLHRRQFNLGYFSQYNRWLMAFLIFSFLSVLYSDFTFVSFKRWIKVLGHPIMVLVLLTEPDPLESITQMMKRLAYVVFPVSILYIKYFPNMGRTFDPFIGAPSNTGIALDKNMLGSVCMILGAFLFWHLLQVLKRPPEKERKWELICVALILAAGFWVLYLAHSSTSLVSMVIAMGIIWVVGLQAIRKDQLTTYLVVTVVLIVVAQYVFNIYDIVLDLLGKDKTLTDRTRVWAEVKTIDINPIIGTGFESFWLGDRREHMWSIFWWHPIQAHNGYLETYLNIGYIGLGFMIMLIVSSYQKANFLLRQGVEFARFRMGYLAAFVLYNCTEAAFKALHPVFFIFFLIAMDYPPPKVENPEPMVET